jgi:hypothetical protein
MHLYTGRTLAAALPRRLTEQLDRLTASGVTHPVLDTLSQILPARAAEALQLAESIA